MEGDASVRYYESLNPLLLGDTVTSTIKPNGSVDIPFLGGDGSGKNVYSCFEWKMIEYRTGDIALQGSSVNYGEIPFSYDQGEKAYIVRLSGIFTNGNITESAEATE